MLILDIDAKVKAWVLSRINIEILLTILCCQAIFLNNNSDGTACAFFILLWAGSFTISTQNIQFLKTNVSCPLIKKNLLCNC